MQRQAAREDRHAGKRPLGFGPFLWPQLLLGSSVSQRGSGDAKALGEVAAFFTYLLASLPVAWMGTIIAF